MKAIAHPKSLAGPPACQGDEFTPSTFREDIRALLLPPKKWHYLFHLVVIVVALSYWILSLVKLPQASWAELAMYRPAGDNQVFPMIAALSQGNFGDPTDVLNYGRGVAGVQVIILFPYALGYAIFGPAGYMIMDGVLAWLYFLAACWLLRRCRFGALTSLVLASALATGALQNFCWMLSDMVTKFWAVSFGFLVDEWHFPALLDLPIFAKRIPRPMITEIPLVLLLYLFVGSWQSGRLSFKGGLAVGGLLALLAQGDPYSFSALGLLLMAVVVKSMAGNQWKVPWGFGLGSALGGLVCGAFFLFQMLTQSPEISVRIGLAHFPRSKLLFLPGYAPILRVAVVTLLAGMFVTATRRLRAFSRGTGHREGTHPGTIPFEQSMATFCVAMVAAGWLAQPGQLFVLGKGAQIFHYLLYTLPTFYAYALVILCFHLINLACRQNRAPERQQPRPSLPWLGAVMLAAVLFLEVSLGVQEPLEGLMSSGTARREESPWSYLGNRYRPNFRELEKQFQTNETLRNARSFATFSHEVNFLLASFYNKRAYLPDNAYSLLSDEELEHRLCEVCKICGLRPEAFALLIKNSQVLNYWLGCAKYWYSAEHTFSTPTDYTADQQTTLKQRTKEGPFNLVLPISEANRLVNQYTRILTQPSDISLYPDLVVMTTALEHQGVMPDRRLYREIYTNEVFSIHAKIKQNGFFTRPY